MFNRLWGAGMLPSKHQAVASRTSGDPVLYLRDPEGISRSTPRRMLDSLRRLNQKQFEAMADPETQARVEGEHLGLLYRCSGDLPPA
ncbi:MAG: DUF1501 domain-containing protein [Gemmataceae bacterium]